MLTIMCVVWSASGWFFVEARSFSTKPTRLSVETTVDGYGAVAIGAVFVTLGLIALAAVLQGTGLRKGTQVLLVTLLLVVPASVVYLL
jgi:hypothetical protein